jgi:hypothetical protein
MATIRVAVRVRPSANAIQIWRIDPENNSIQAVGSSVSFTFNRVFIPEEKNFEIYQAVASDIVDEVMKGTNGTIFAYGSTGSGKTYTIMGEGSEPGITPLAVDHIFRYIERHTERTFVVEFSYFEIYNEKVRDLLNERAVADVRIRYTQQVARSAQHLIDTIITAEANRATGATSMNEHSSRSHAIVRIAIESFSNSGDGQVRLASVLNLVDLAGSECQKNTNAEGDRQHEASKINKSLLALSKLIDSLQNGKSVAVWRESKLTLYLQNSIGGNALTAIICAINSDISQKNTSEYSLRFASKAMKVRNQPKVNQIVTDKGRLEQLTEENRLLKERIDILEAGPLNLQEQNDEPSDDAIDLPRKILSRNAVNVAKRLLATPPKRTDEDSDGIAFSRTLSPIGFQPSPIELPKRKPRVVVGHQSEKMVEDDEEVDREADSLSREILMRVRTSNSPFSMLSELGVRSDEETQVDLVVNELESLKARASELETEKVDFGVKFSELDSERSEFAGRIRELEEQLTEREYLLQNASHVSTKLQEQQELIAELRNRITRKEAELKGANFTRSIIQNKLEQKDVTLIQFGERIQSQREEIEALTSQVTNQNRELAELRVRCDVLSCANREKQRLLESQESEKRQRATQETETELTNIEICQIITRTQKPLGTPPTPNYATMLAKLKEKTQIVPAPPRKRPLEESNSSVVAVFDNAKPKRVKFTLQRFVVADCLAELELEEPLCGKEAETQTETAEEEVISGLVWRPTAAISEIALAFAVVAIVCGWIASALQ